MMLPTSPTDMKGSINFVRQLEIRKCFRRYFTIGGCIEELKDMCRFGDECAAGTMFAKGELIAPVYHLESFIN